eukprot:CAMPEP_0172727176 /NCGR_PEP_ID=MMETSP1074-20121228/91535_1 /TAXON_ID=2916 /ORGANISM="Ceratium fusus, Strain PA161109" /LENGTH=62 /DNA_ID=CAMNT_0013554301 /DNA_START=145 /DNA_END=330 /DNA_ORIENTATION=+
MSASMRGCRQAAISVRTLTESGKFVAPANDGKCPFPLGGCCQLACRPPAAVTDGPNPPNLSR